MYADDTSLLSISSDTEIQQWAHLWHMTFNSYETVFLQISNYKTFKSPIFLMAFILRQKRHTHLGITLSRNMQWTSNTERVLERVNQRLVVLQCLKFSLSCDCLSYFYKTMILLIIDYGDVIYDNNAMKTILIA